ncbi:MAG: hypothetical protein KGL39_33910 [Patescibacteria group bacterium]|nr:hypothetical protein [Patescibacteria group bacterium]
MQLTKGEMFAITRLCAKIKGLGGKVEFCFKPNGGGIEKAFISSEVSGETLIPQTSLDKPTIKLVDSED